MGITDWTLMNASIGLCQTTRKSVDAIYTLFKLTLSVRCASEIAETEAAHLISSADTNQDGKLSVSEIVDSHEVFVGSEATHFGEQLRDEL